MKILILGVNGFIGNALTRRILTTTDWEVYGLDLDSDKLDRVPGPSPLPLPGRRHHHQQGVDRIPHQEVRRGPAPGGHRHPDDLRQAAPAGLRAGLRGKPPDHPPVRQVQQAHHLPLHLRGLRHVPRRGVRRGRLAPWCWARSTSSAGSTAAPSSSWTGSSGPTARQGAAVLPVPPLQLDRPQAGRPVRRQGGEFPGGDPVHPQPPRSGSRSSWWTAATRSAASPTWRTASTA